MNRSKYVMGWTIFALIGFGFFILGTGFNQPILVLGTVLCGFVMMFFLGGYALSVTNDAKRPPYLGVNLTDDDED